MPKFSQSYLIAAPVFSLFLSTHAFAQPEADAQRNAEAESGGRVETHEAQVGAGQPQSSLPAPRSDNDPAPPVASPVVAATVVTEQAGVGGTQAYGRAGVLELGGSFDLTSATNYLSVGFNPTIGWFFMDNVEVSAIIGVNYNKTTVVTPSIAPNLPATETDVSSTGVRLLLEPSFHIPFSQHIFAFAGLGFGLASQSSDPGEDPGTGFAIAPRLGMNIMVGRSGIFTPAIQGVFQSTKAVQTPQGAVIAVDSSTGIGAGYTVMW